MKHLYHLSTCTTCKKVIAQLGLAADVTLQDLKTNPISEKELDALAALSGSYESLFNRRSRLYTSQGLAKKELTEAHYKSYILSHYTFLKRPVIRVGDQVFIGYKKDTIAAAAAALNP